MKLRKLLLSLCVAVMMFSALLITASAADTTPGRQMIISTEDGYFYGYHYNKTTYVPLYIFADTFGGNTYGWSFEECVAYVKAPGLYLVHPLPVVHVRHLAAGQGDFVVVGVVVQPPLEGGVERFFLQHTDALGGDVPLPHAGAGFVEIQVLHLRNR